MNTADFGSSKMENKSFGTGQVRKKLKLMKKKINIFKSYSSPSPRIPPSPSSALIEEQLEVAEPFIFRWDVDSTEYNSSSSYALNSLFSPENRHEAKHYLAVVKDLQAAMQCSLLQNSGDPNLIRANTLMRTAMKRLEREFYQILRSNRDCLDPESVSTHSSRASRSTFSELADDSDEDSHESITEVERASLLAMADLKAMADCMIASGYTKKCVRIYKIIRKSIVDEALYHLGVERLSVSQIQKMDWEVLEVKIKSWLHAVKVAVKTLFLGERILCDEVFAASASIRDSVFMEISKEGALRMFGFAESVAKCKKAPEVLFRILDLHEAVSNLLPEIEYIFSSDSNSAVWTIATNSLAKLRDCARAILTNFESAIQKESSKSSVAGAGVHPLTLSVMNYVAFLADYRGVLSEIMAKFPLSVQSAMTLSYSGRAGGEERVASPIAILLTWLILLLLCKLDGKAKRYKEPVQSYLFLANNLKHVVVKVENSNLKFLLGDDWLAEHEETAKQYVANYERMGWSKVVASLPEDPTAEISVDRVRDHFSRFNAAFEEAYTKQATWVIPDPSTREEIKISLARRICRVYQNFYEKYGWKLRTDTLEESIVRFTPEDVGNYLSDLFHGNGSSIPRNGG